jgi:hypothetical protein
MARDLPLIESAIGMNWINEIRFSKMGSVLVRPAVISTSVFSYGANPGKKARTV